MELHQTVSENIPDIRGRGKKKEHTGCVGCPITSDCSHEIPGELRSNTGIELPMSSHCSIENSVRQYFTSSSYKRYTNLACQPNSSVGP